MNSSTPKAHVTARTDPLSQRFLELSERYRSLNIAAETLKLHVEFAIRHIHDLAGNQDAKEMIVTRLKAGLAQFNSSISTEEHSHWIP